ncbi:hypothetical protein J4476_04000 [Candidatus Woesearchaeota archaeon]|nr:MAG: hypothetical protein QT09_C0009G0023 [archaeon GW2011_AR18]MBS3161827.1 hypothetical protein [Candidatus Woesearchaeota archaeon]HIH26059.1 hypothetical protein [Nanoarchaeota archaeon]
MQIVEKALGEIKNFFLLLDIGNSLLNSLILFLTSLLISNFLGIEWKYSLIISIIYFTYHIIKKHRINKYLEVEEKTPSLKEQLRTVADNVNKTNPIIDELKDDVLKKMRDVKTSNFIDNKSLILRVLILGGLSFSILFLSYINVDFKGEIQQIIIEPINEIGLRGNVQEAVYMNISVTEGNLSDILGNNSIARFKKENIKLTINPLLSETDPSDIRQVQAESFTPPDFPKEIYTSYDVSYNEKVAKQNQQVVKDYFEKINR